MRKAKYMLITISILASVGAAMAFKAQRFGNSKYCFAITDAEPPIGSCTLTLQNRFARPVFGGEDMVYYTTTNNVANCPLASCTVTGIPDQQ